MKVFFRIAILILLSSWILISLFNQKEYKDIIVNKASRDIAAIPVTVTTLKKSEISREIEISGTVENSSEVFIISTVSGEIKELKIQPGDYVNKGQVLAEVDDYYLNQQYQIARQAYEQDKKDLERYKNLKDSEAITNQQLEMLTLKLEASKTKMELANRRLQESKIKATVSGNVNQLFVSKGGMIGQGKPVCEIIGDQNNIIKTGIQEEYIEFLEAGKKVELYDFKIKYPTSAYIQSIGVKPGFMGKIPMEIAFEQVESLYPGKVVDIRIGTSIGESLAIPSESILTKGSESYVFIVKNKIVQSTPIEILQKLDNQVVIKTGLNEGDVIVLEGNHLLNDGDQIKIIKEEQ
jgi:RND family efflux transporter MFP subunit